jgi:tRNA-2-methylthio-N6-dimethylallyladenosine synthase
MNVLDSQLVRGSLQSLGYTFTDDWKQADVILYNTCSVREQAENKAYSRLGLVGIRKKTNPSIVLGVIGCMAERDGLDMFRRYPQVDLLCGPGELDKVPLLIDNVVRTRRQSSEFGGPSFELKGNDPEGVSVASESDSETRNAKRGTRNYSLQGNTHRRSTTLAAAEDTLELLDLARSFSPDEHKGSAYVRITRGCNKFCSYCVVPNTRGREVHRAPDAIVEECRKLVDSGVVEITLLGQTVNHYHYDHAGAQSINGVVQPQVGSIINNTKAQGLPSLGVRAEVTTFAQLLARIHDEIPTLQRLRFVTSFPRDFGDDILHTIAERPRICRYLHLPVQSGSNRILKLMNRGYTVEEYRELLARIRRILPDATIASDLICGFPTETEEDHRATCDLLRDANYKNCFIFKYSPRPGTTAIDRFEDDVPDEVKRARNNELLRIQAQNSDTLHRGYVGQTVRVFVESMSVKEQKKQKSLNTIAPNIELGWSQPLAASHSSASTTTLAPTPPPGTQSQLTGRTDGDLIVMFDGDPSLVGSIVEVKITKHAPLALFGSLRSHALNAAL